MDSNINNKKSERENSLGIWRVVFTFVIMSFHVVDGTSFYTEYPMIQYHWYIAVEFFFVLSGFLLMKHMEKHGDETPLMYLKGRIVRLYPEYIITFFIMAIMRSYLSGLNIIKIIIPNWLEAFMLQSIGTNKFPYINNPAWYVSALIIVSYFVYYLLANYKKLYLQFIGPIGTMVIISYLFREYGRLENFYTTKAFCANAALLRAFAGITIGVYAYLASKRLRESIGKNKYMICSVLEVFVFIGVLAFALLVEDGEYDFLFLFLFAIGIVLASEDKRLGKLSENVVLKNLERISYSMYLIHFFAIFILNEIVEIGLEWHWWYLILYYFLTAFVAFVLHTISERLLKTIFCYYSTNRLQ